MVVKSIVREMRSRISTPRISFLEGDKAKSIFLLCLLFIAMSLFLTTYLCPGTVCSSPNHSFNDIRIEKLREITNGKRGHPLPAQELTWNTSTSLILSFDQVLNDKSFVFDIDANDVIVFLHIQKTGGTMFDGHVVRDLKLQTPCICPAGKKRCICTRPSDAESFWLFSRNSMGWKCGLHADWTELNHCVNNIMDVIERTPHPRRYFYITFLRDPVARFLSEWRHVQRGATWKNSIHWCGGQTHQEGRELPPCYFGQDWKNVSLREFLSCPWNLALNRQTRMLADLSLVNCYNTSHMTTEERDLILLESAKQNLRRTAFFGICENQTASQYLFETTFHMTFKRPFIQLNRTRSSYTLDAIDSDDLELVRKLNYLDLELYNYAGELLNERFEKMKRKDPDFNTHFSRIKPIKLDLDETEERLIQRIEKQRLQIAMEKRNKETKKSMIQD